MLAQDRPQSPSDLVFAPIALLLYLGWACLERLAPSDEEGQLPQPR